MQPHEFGCFLFWVGFFGLDVEDRNGSSYAALRVGLFHTEFFDSTVVSLRLNVNKSHQIVINAYGSLQISL